MHSFRDGVHRYAGEFPLPNSCYSIAVHARYNIKDPSRVILALMTRDGMTDTPFCLKISTRYKFETLVEAPVDVIPTLLIDEMETPIRVRETSWPNPKKTILN